MSRQRPGILVRVGQKAATEIGPLQHGSWLNIAEKELSSPMRQCLDGRRIGELKTLSDEIKTWSGGVNSTQKGVDWQMKAGDAIVKLKAVYPKILSRRSTSNTAFQTSLRLLAQKFGMCSD